MAIGSKELAPTELDTFEDERLVEELKKAKEELFNLRFQAATGQLEGHGRIRSVKRDIARLYTVIRERELGIRATPAPVEAAAPVEKKKSKKAKDSDQVSTEAVAPAATAEAPAAETAEESK
jgi:large subunit ribosomal protein L29